MAAKAAAAVPAPVAVPAAKTRKKPDFGGVPGQIFDISRLTGELQFGVRSLRVSPYDAILKQLEESESPNMAAKFEDTRARASVTARAKKLNLSVTFAEYCGALFVKFIGYLPDHPKFKENNRRVVMMALRSAPGTPMQVMRLIRETSPRTTLDAVTVETILKQLLREKLVYLNHNTNMWTALPDTNPSS